MIFGKRGLLRLRGMYICEGKCRELVLYKYSRDNGLNIPPQNYVSNLFNNSRDS
jgi:hypothetical protein